jgi:hypothetical protein
MPCVPNNVLSRASLTRRSLRIYLQANVKLRKQQNGVGTHSPTKLEQR